MDQLVGYLRNKTFCVDTLYFHNDETFNKIISRIENKYIFYAFSIFINNISICYKISEYIKQHFEDSLICFGGQFASLMYKDIFNVTKYVDFIILGDGEIPFEYLINNHKDINKIIEYPYIAYKSKNYDLYPYKNKKIYWKQCCDFFYRNKIYSNSTYNIQIKNNICTGNCTFCFTNKTVDIYFKDIDFIIDEITYINKKFNIKTIYFSDDDITDPNDITAKYYLIDLCNKIIERNLKINIVCYLKASSFHNNPLDITVLKKMKEAGFIAAFVGIESGNEYDLKLYNKKSNLEENKNIISILRDNGILPLVGFININPYSTIDSLQHNFIFLKSIHSTNIEHYSNSVLLVYKYTPIYKKLLKDGLLKSNYSYLNTKAYGYICSDVERIVEFLNKYFLEDEEINKFETINSLLLICAELERYNNNVDKMLGEVSHINNEYFHVYSHYFERLYMNQDIQFCKNNFDKLKLFLYSKDKKIKIIKSKLIKCVETYI